MALWHNSQLAIRKILITASPAAPPDDLRCQWQTLQWHVRFFGHLGLHVRLPPVQAVPGAYENKELQRSSVPAITCLRLQPASTVSQPTGRLTSKE
jgi:hypothetical protein